MQAVLFLMLRTIYVCAFAHKSYKYTSVAASHLQKLVIIWTDLGLNYLINIKCVNHNPINCELLPVNHIILGLYKLKY